MTAVASNIIERYGGAEQERSIWFHGTSPKLLPTILVEGLIPNPKQRSWDVDNDTSSTSVSRASLDGVYLTRNFMTAYSAGGRTSRRDGIRGSTLMVCVSLQPRSLVADEDSVSAYVSKITGYGDALNALWYYRHLLLPSSDAYTEESVSNSRKNWVEDRVNLLRQSLNLRPFHREFEDRLREFLHDEMWPATVTRLASYASKEASDVSYRWVREWPSEMQKQPDTIPSLPSPSEGERVFRIAVDKLTRLLKRAARNSTAFIQTGRSLQPIRFSGSNRIACIAELIQPEDNESYKIVVHYGTPPDELLSQYKDRITSKFSVENSARLRARSTRVREAVDRLLGREELPALPSVLYHGSPRKFDKFDLNYFGRVDDGYYGVGVYLATTEENANDYGPWIYRVKLTNPKPFYLWDSGVMGDTHRARVALSKLPEYAHLAPDTKLPEGYRVVRAEDEGNGWRPPASGWRVEPASDIEDARWGDIKDTPEMAIIAFNDEGTHGYHSGPAHAGWTTSLLKREGRNKFADVLAKNGYNCLAVYDSSGVSEVMVFDPAMITVLDVKFQRNKYDIYESVKHAAIQLNGNVYTGSSHYACWMAAAESMGVAQDKADEWMDRHHHEAIHGFVTDEGEFLDRKAAHAHSAQAGQIDPQDSRFASRRGQREWLDSKDISESVEKLLDKPTKTPEELADLHGVPVEDIQRELLKGIRVEKEHTSKDEVAREIALDHLAEDPQYYTKLKKVETNQ